ncbi:acyl-CoA dehydrogenase family protein [Thermanaeromonas sp. C210]|uniref:acyl-CoA dehydrogenase family protein n=1 Tax=Thermanaeromonas sp. C210 TaxID=2731925 RepID=UPI001566D982|nr:acyl-CoA dehydrogenase family protein [Thermanaeromonas sp. C210]
MVDALLTPEQQKYLELARKFTREKILPVAAQYDRTGEFPWPVVEAAREIGLHCMTAPRAYGGPELDSVTISLIMEEFAYGCAGIATTLGGNGLSSYPVLIAGTEEQKKLFFGRLLAGGLGAFALTEPGAGSDAGAVSTSARREGDEYVINGTKCFITTGAMADIFIVFASTNPTMKARGLSAFIVEREREGISIGHEEDKMGIRASNTVEVRFNNVRVPADHLLGKEGEGFKIAMQTLDMARPIVGAIAVGVARAALEECIDYVKSRMDGTKPLSANQAVQFRIADMAMKVEAARLMVRRALALKEAGVPYSKESAMAKAYASDVAMEVTAEAVEIMGAVGYSKDSRVEKLMRDAKITQIYEGTNQIQRIVIANNLLRS